MLNRLYSWYGKDVVWGVSGIIVVLAGAGLIINSLSKEPPETAEERVPGVEVARVGDLSGTGTLELIGSVEAVNEVHLEAEAGGRLTSVPVRLGQSVRSGQTIAQIENASEYAALLQAEGVYDASVASAATSDVSVEDARSNAVDAYRNAYATTRGIFLNTIDPLYSNPRSQTPGVKIDGMGWASYLNTRRSAFNDTLEEFQEKAVALDINDNLEAALAEALDITTKTLELVDKFIELLPRQSGNGIFTSAQITTFQSNFTSARQSLNATLATINNVHEALRRANIAGTGSTNSAADAQIKQALGSLRAAQASYAKTIISTPISGTVNTLSVKAGDYVSPGSPIAIIANNNTLLITTYVSESLRDRIAEGDGVLIENTYEGRITTIAPAIDPATNKIEVQIQTYADGLSNGATVRLTIEARAETANTSDIVIPISALKVETDRIVIFTVSEDGTLVAHNIEEGPLVGDGIIIRSGVTPDVEIVVDARGRSEGDRVNILNQ